MGSFANTLFTMMLGWIQTAVAAIWNTFTTENGDSLLKWIGNHWILLAAILCAIGLIADLGIYLVRWRPLRVWRSFFNRVLHRENETEPPEQTGTDPTPSGNLFSREEESVPVRNLQKPITAAEEEDFSRWVTEEPAPVYAEPVPKKPTITGAGYTVPADSPYRRPAEPSVYDRDPVTAMPAEPQSVKPEIMSQRKRRRRLTVSNLFSDPEEELYQYETPQQLIDQNKAYHQPVYPRNWKRDEGEGE